MKKKLFIILKKDFITARRDAMATYIMVVPLIMAVGITLFAPGLNDTTVKLAMLKSDDTAHIEYMKQFSKGNFSKKMMKLEKG